MSAFTGSGFGEVIVDVFLLSGEGEDEVRIIRREDSSAFVGIPDAAPSGLEWGVRMVTGVASPLGSPPEEGLV